MFPQKHPAPTRSRGFTLVEIALVLAVIGLILGAIAIGKDTQRAAEYNRIANKFVGEWVTAYNQYYTRRGVPVGDNTEAPTQAVNGRTLTRDGDTGAITFAGTDRLTGPIDTSIDCNAVGTLADSTGTTWDGAAGLSAATIMRCAAVKVPTGNGGNNVHQLAYADGSGIVRQLEVGFQYFDGPGVDSCGGLVGNVMVLTGVTSEFGRVLDQRVDGIINGTTGILRAVDPGTIQTAIAWPVDADEAAATVSTVCYKMIQ